ncbi:hypothetical protein LQW54_000901 [Pestalotiopsis sp. IQ-011]
MIMVSGYYTQSEQALRQSWWFSGTEWFTICIYVLAGGLTLLFALWCFFLPGSPADAWFLGPEERRVAVERLRLGQTGVGNQDVKTGQIKEALLDPKVWLVSLIMAAGYHNYTVNGAVSGFGPLIASTFGYSSLESILFQFPLGSVCAVGIPLAGWICSRYRNVRIPLLLLCCLPVIAGRDALSLDEAQRNTNAFKDMTDKENLHFRYVL